MASLVSNDFNVSPNPLETPGLNPATQSLLDSMRDTMWNQVQAQSQLYMPRAAPAPPPSVHPSQGVAIQTEDEVAIDRSYGGPQYWELQEDFQDKLGSLRDRLLPELRVRKEELLREQSAAEARIEKLRQLVAEAEREAHQEFEGVRQHLRSVVEVKAAVLRGDRSQRQETIRGIDEVIEKIRSASTSGSLFMDSMGEFVDEYPELYSRAETWLARPVAPHIEVSLDDVPFEARLRRDKMKKFAVMEQLHRSKDRCLWQVHQRGRALEAELQEAGLWQQQLEKLLDHYASEFSHVCYFCGVSFSVTAANTHCMYNTGRSPRSGFPLPPTPQVPPELWGNGVHFWVARPSEGPGKFPPMDPVWNSPSPSRSTAAMPNVAMYSQPSSQPQAPPWHAPWSWQQMQTPPAYSAPPREESMVSGPSAEASMQRLKESCEKYGVDLKEVFKAFDATEDGFLNQVEFCHALGSLQPGITISDKEAKSMLSKLRVNVDGMVSYTEFLAMVHGTVGMTATREVPTFGSSTFQNDPAYERLLQKIGRSILDRGVPLQYAFAAFDADGDGILTRGDLMTAFRAMRLGLSDDDVERLLRTLDPSMDGRISIAAILNRLQ